MLRSNNRSWRMLLIAIVAVLAFSMIAGCGKKEENAGAAKGKDISKVIATYDGGEITEAEFDKELSLLTFWSPEVAQYKNVDQIRQLILKQQIAYEYSYNKADDKTKEEGKKAAEEQLAQVKKQTGDQFKSILDSQKISEQELKDYMVRNATVLQGEIAKLKDEDIKKEFEAKKQEYTVASVRHILFNFKDPNGKERTKEATLKLAKDMKARLDKGEDFATLAKKYSEDPGSKDDGGLYKDKAVSLWVDAFKQAALTLPIGKISDPVETEYGYHIIRVEARKEKKFEDLSKDDLQSLKNSLANKSFNEFMTGDLEKKIIKKIDLPKVETSGNGTGSTTTDKSGK